jgi:hypothetical protein
MGLGIHGIGGWVEQGTGFDAFENKNLLPPLRVEPITSAFNPLA